MVLLLLGINITCFNLPGLQNDIFNEVSWPIKLIILKELNTKTTESKGYRRVGIQAYKMKRVLRDDDGEVIKETTQSPQKDDSSMKMKLFRLMYETIRDSDVKVRRAEVIKKYYANSTAFNLGYVMGEITDRFNVMSDIALTLQRLYSEWRPMEHINAYEQIANKAVEVSHLADAARNIMKKDSDYLQRYKVKV
ncbi:uncharacterized protein [Epargyreus clarus]|uniref:uncharacterized protein n=1 Tax=Epargyreus clarus TaxID=520877 RepID=UPI003C2E78BC